MNKVGRINMLVDITPTPLFKILGGAQDKGGAYGLRIAKQGFPEIRQG